jgi:hypothetical protein
MRFRLAVLQPQLDGTQQRGPYPAASFSTLRQDQHNETLAENVLERPTIGIVLGVSSFPSRKRSLLCTIT